MKRDKLLAEWFWTDRYDGSSAAEMNMECQGVYRSMLSRAWRRGGSLPNDHEAIQRAIRCTAEEWARCWPKVKGFWRVQGDTLVNDTQIEVYAEAVQAHERAQARAQAGAQASAQARAQARAQAELSVSVSVSGTETRTETAPVPVIVESPAQATGAQPVNGSSGNGHDDGARREYYDAVWEAYVARTGETTRIAGPADYAWLKRWYDEGVPLRVVLHGIRETRGTGKNLGYYWPSVEVEYGRVRRTWR